MERNKVSETKARILDGGINLKINKMNKIVFPMLSKMTEI